MVVRLWLKARSMQSRLLTGIVMHPPKYLHVPASDVAVDGHHLATELPMRTIGSSQMGP